MSMLSMMVSAVSHGSWLLACCSCGCSVSCASLLGPFFCPPYGSPEFRGASSMQDKKTTKCMHLDGSRK